MLPTSVDPRAKKKITGRQPKRVYSLAVMPTLEDWRASISTGAAAAKVARRATRAVENCILAVEEVGSIKLLEVGSMNG